MTVKNVLSPIILLVLLTTHDSSGQDGGPEDKVKLKLKNKDGAEEDFSNESNNFENIPKLRNAPITEFCGIGTWLFYERPHLLNKNFTSLEGISMFTSDDENKCFTTEELGHDLGSVQPLTGFSLRKRDTITFFQYENFIGRRMTVNKAIKQTDEEPGYYQFIKSVITLGHQEWIVVMEGPTRVCFKPPQTMEFPVCLISQLIDDDNLVPSGVLQVSHARDPCDPKSTTTIVIETCDCYEYTQGIVHPMNSPAFGENKVPCTTEPEKNDTTTTTTPPTNGTECEINNDVLDEELVDLIGARLNGSLGSGEWFSAIKDPKQIWKAELFDKSFQVLNRICPDSVIDKEYLLLFASLYFHHMGKVWDSGKFLDTTISELAWMEILHDMNRCISTISVGDYSGIATDTANEMKTYTSLEDVTGKLENMLGYRPDYDHVMEINWLMANLVSSICTKGRDYDVNFLPRFLNIFHVLYFSPIEEQWTNPGKFAMIYKYLFGGYGMHKSLTKIALCTYNAMKFSGITEPYKRPMDQVDKIFLPKAEVTVS